MGVTGEDGQALPRALLVADLEAEVTLETLQLSQLAAHAQPLQEDRVQLRLQSTTHNRKLLKSDSFGALHCKYHRLNLFTLASNRKLLKMAPTKHY